MKEKPYIGISGIASEYEAFKVNQVFSKYRLDQKDSPYLGMAGFLVSQSAFENKLPSRPQYPSVDELNKLLRISYAASFNSIHYHTRNPETLYEQLSDLLDFLRIKKNKLVDGVQLNVAWPNPEVIEKIKKEYPDLKVILQLGPEPLQESGESLEERLKNYKAVDYCLIDVSAGKGKELDPFSVADVIEIARDILASSALIYAGGLSPENVEDKIAQLKYLMGGKYFGVDVQRRIRTESSDRIDTRKIISYTSRSLRALRET